MTGSNSLSGRADGVHNEESPLLNSSTSNTYGTDEAVVENGNLQAQEPGGPGLESGHPPDLSKLRSYTHSHWLAPDEDQGTTAESETPAEGEILLGGVSKTKFRLIFGGILVGYFVSGFLFEVLRIAKVLGQITKITLFFGFRTCRHKF